MKFTKIRTLAKYAMFFVAGSALMASCADHDTPDGPTPPTPGTSTLTLAPTGLVTKPVAVQAEELAVTLTVNKTSGVETDINVTVAYVENAESMFEAAVAAGLIDADEDVVVLDADVATLDPATVKITKSQTSGATTLNFDLDAVRVAVEEAANTPDARFFYPVAIVNPNITNVSVDATKSFAIIEVVLAGENQSVISLDPFGLQTGDEIALTATEFEYAFEIVKTEGCIEDIEVELAYSAAALAAYNAAEGTALVALDEDIATIETSPVTIAGSALLGAATIVVDMDVLRSFIPDANPDATYVYPVAITSVSCADALIDNTEGFLLLELTWEQEPEQHSTISLNPFGLQEGDEIALEDIEFSYEVEIVKTEGCTDEIEVELEYSAAALTAYNDAEGAALVALAENLATIETSPVTIAGSALSGAANIVFDVDALRTFMATADPDATYVYPVAIGDVSCAYAQVEAAEGFLLLELTWEPEPVATEVTVTLTGKGEATDGGVANRYRLLNLDERTFTLTVNIDEVLEDDLTVDFAADNALVTAYNTDNTTSYLPLPAAAFSAADDLVITAGATTGTVDITIDPTKLPVSQIDGAEYMLAVKLTGSDYGNATIEANPYVYFTIETAPIDLGTYAMTRVSGDQTNGYFTTGSPNPTTEVLYAKNTMNTDLKDILTTDNWNKLIYTGAIPGSTRVPFNTSFLPIGTSADYLWTKSGLFAAFNITDTETSDGSGVYNIDMIWLSADLIGNGTTVITDNISTFDSSTGELNFNFIAHQDIWTSEPRNIKRSLTPIALP